MRNFKKFLKKILFWVFVATFVLMLIFTLVEFYIWNGTEAPAPLFWAVIGLVFLAVAFVIHFAYDLRSASRR